MHSDIWGARASGARTCAGCLVRGASRGVRAGDLYLFQAQLCECMKRRGRDTRGGRVHTRRACSGETPNLRARTSAIAAAEPASRAPHQINQTTHHQPLATACTARCTVYVCTGRASHASSHACAWERGRDRDLGEMCISRCHLTRIAVSPSSMGSIHTSRRHVRCLTSIYLIWLPRRHILVLIAASRVYGNDARGVRT